MARIRSVHPELCIDETLCEVSARAERTFVRLWPHLDDEGRARDNVKLLKAALYPLHDDVTSADVDQDMTELASVGLVIRYEVNGERFLTAKPDAWKRWQKPRHFYPSKLPAPEERNDTSDHSVRRESDEGETAAGLELVGVELSGEVAAAEPSDVRPTTVRLGREERQRLIDQSIEILTDRHLEANPTKGTNPDRHRRAVLNGKASDYGRQAHALLLGQPMTPIELANVLEPGSKPLRTEDDLVPAFTNAPAPADPHALCGPECEHGWLHPNGPDGGALRCPGASA